MSSLKTIYSCAKLECALELLWRTMGVRINESSAICSVVSVDGQYSALRITALPVALDGGQSIYTGASDFTYRKFPLDTIMPTDMVYDGEYPTTFERLQQFLKFSYDFVLEEDEFEVEGSVQPALKVGDFVNVAANVNGQLVLRAAATSGRWLSGSHIRLKLLPYVV